MELKGVNGYISQHVPTSLFGYTKLKSKLTNLDTTGSPN